MEEFRLEAGRGRFCIFEQSLCPRGGGDLGEGGVGDRG